MRRLATFLRIEAIVMLAFAVGWLFMPALVNGDILGWDTETFWPRVMGGGFFGLAYGAWRTADRLSERLDLVWMFAAFPIGYFTAMVVEGLSGDYTGSGLFWWVCATITAGFGLGILGLRALVGTRTVAPTPSTTKRQLA